LTAVIITTNRLDYGGAERQRVVLANGLARRGYAVEVRLLQAGGPLQDVVMPTVRVRLLRHYWSMISSMEKRALISGTTRTEVWYGFLSMLLSFGRVRWVVAVHNPIPDDARLFPRLRAAMMNKAHAVVHLGHGQVEKLRCNSGVRGRRWIVVPNGVDARGIREQLTVEGEGEGGGAEPVLLFVGRLSEQKGLDVLFESLCSCADLRWTLLVAGAGPERDALMANLARRPIAGRVHWLGAVPAASVMGSADLVVLPSRNENHPLVLLEAAVAGLPVVATEVGSVPEIMGEAVGLTCPPADPVALSMAIRQVLLNLDAYRCKALERQDDLTERFSEQQMVDAYDRLITSLW
jgi:glycosyltransferase involved in cell wall biosynthesis